MPYTAKQRRLFQAAAHDPAIAKRTGVSQHDARKMLAEGKTGKRHPPVRRSVMKG